MNLSAVMVTHNSAAVVETCWRSVRRLLPGAEVLVIDNSSSDDTVARCRRLDGLRVLAGTDNIGFGRACNQGVSAATASHVLTLNPDVELGHVDTSALEAEIDGEPFGLVAGVLRDNIGGGSLTEHWTRDLLRHAVGPIRPRELPGLPKFPVRHERWWPGGAMLLVNREEFMRLGGFDPRFFLYYEDRDLARRYRAAGLPVRRTDALQARHLGGTSSTGELAGESVRNGWGYLSWIEYLSTWHGADTARRAAGYARLARTQVDRTLALLELAGPMSQRATRKRRDLAELERFIQWQSSFEAGTAAEDFCPNARRIVASL